MQRHSVIFSKHIRGDLTPPQWSALFTLLERGACSQNHLGRMTAMDVATIKGVVDRLKLKGLTKIGVDPSDNRRRVVELTMEGRRLARSSVARAGRITELTLAPLDGAARKTLLSLLSRLR
jgi:MarR family transcriptional regulator, lower aerobic nicotinate degradation pathway regulator